MTQSSKTETADLVALHPSSSSLPARLPEGGLPIQVLETITTQRDDYASAWRLWRQDVITTEAFQNKTKDLLSKPSLFLQKGTDEQILDVVEAIFDIWPAKRSTSDVVAAIWLRNLRDFPLSAIWGAFEKLTKQANQWRPDPGAFRQAVRDYDNFTQRLLEVKS